MAEGLLFFKPPRFIPRSSLVSIGAGRGGSNATRYVDCVLRVSPPPGSEGASDEDVEFTNIEREELGHIDSYIKDVLTPAMARDARDDSGEAVKAEPGRKVEADDDDVVLPPSKPLRSKRGAAEASAAATRAQIDGGALDEEEEEEDDEDDEAFDDSEEDESDDDGESDGEGEDSDDDDDDDDDDVFEEQQEEELMQELEAMIEEGDQGEAKRRKVE